jgi:hypothetical protein
MFDQPPHNLLGDWSDDQLDWAELCSARYIWEQTTRPWYLHPDTDEDPGFYPDWYGRAHRSMNDDEWADPFSDDPWDEEDSW